MLSLGIVSFGFLSVVPLLGLGLNAARLARENRATAQIADTLIEQARQGATISSLLYFDSASQPATAVGACFVVRETTSTVAPDFTAGGPLTRLTISVTPAQNFEAARVYVDVFPTPSGL